MRPISRLPKTFYFAGRRSCHNPAQHWHPVRQEQAGFMRFARARPLMGRQSEFVVTSRTPIFGQPRRRSCDLVDSGICKLAAKEILGIRRAVSRASAKFSEGGDGSIFTEEFCNRYNSRLRLTDRGREQAVAAGVWLRENVGERFDRCLVSGFLRVP